MTLNKNKPIVLVVDDSPGSLNMINTALDEAGYTVLIALNGQQAITIAEQLTPDVILMDAMMPVMDGFACCQKLRERMYLVPIIFMTGLTESDSVVKAFECGGNDYISKPIQAIELIARIKAHVNNANLIKDARSALDTAKQFIFSVNDNGRIVWATLEAQSLLRHITDKRRLQESIAGWLKEQAKQNLAYQFANQKMNIAYFKKGNEGDHLLRIIQNEAMFNADTLRETLALTKRESEVLLWVAQGKSNKEIAAILSMSPRTVNKHLEQIFPKIKVENRTAATALAIQVLLN